MPWFYGENSAHELSDELFALLNAIQKSGALRSAAETCQVSYRHAWGLLQTLEQNIGHPLVQLQRGKGASLTGLV